MTTSFDIRLPELFAPRERDIEPAPRDRAESDSEFAGLLEASLNEPREPVRETDAPAMRPRTDGKGDDTDTQPNRVEHRTEGTAERTEPVEAPAAPQEPARTVSTEQSATPAPESPSNPGESGAKPTEIIAAPLAAPQASPPAPMSVLSGADSKTAGPPAPGPQLPQQPLATQSPAPAAAPSIPAGEKVAKQTPAPSRSTPQDTFAATIAAAQSPIDAPGSRSSTKGNREATAPAAELSHPAAPQATTVAAVPPVPAANGEAQNAPRPAHDNVAVAVRTAPVAGTPMHETASAAEEQDTATLLRMSSAGPTPAANRPANKESAAPPAPNPAPATVDLQIEMPAIPAEHAKPEGPARPFAGALAPGLGIAAQITAQQTPEQANAAERLIQLAGTQDVETQALSLKGEAEATDSADEPSPPPPRLDQATHVESGAGRSMSAEAATAAAHARGARAVFHPMIAQVAAHVVQAALDGNDRISIRLSPADLGRIDVRLDFGPDGRVQAVFAADRAQTVELLQRDARDLERALQDAGLRADSGSLSFNLRGEGRSAPDEGTPRHGGGGHADAHVEIPMLQMQAYGAGAASSGRLDIRI